MLMLFRVAIAAIALPAAGISGCASEQPDGTMAHSGPAMNYHKIDDRLATGGHFVDDGLAELQKQGVKVVIDLRDEPPSGQQRKLANAGIEWISIPVVWKDPKREDFARFSEAMSTYEKDNVLVQCQANYRASAMTYLYRVTVGGVTEKEARKDLYAIWEPNDQWQAYIDSIVQRAN